MSEQTILHYRIERLLGKGGMGEVYLAYDPTLDRRVALKTLPDDMANDPARLSRFKTEARASAALNHPNIAQIYSIEGADGMYFITMEYVDGKPLHDSLSGTGIPVDRFLSWFIPLSDALTHAHERGVTHRDLKPNNIMITDEGIPKILDFGLAEITRPEEEEKDPDASTSILTQDGLIMGTPAYMSPEQAAGQKADHRSDLFSLGIIMYRAITGQPPFEGSSYAALMGSIMHVDPPLVTASKPDTPRDLGKIVRRCLQKDLRNRYQTARDMLNDLNDLKADIDAGTVILEAGTVAVDPITPEPPPVWRKPVPLAVALLLIVLTAGAGWLSTALQPPPPEPLVRKFQIPIEGTLARRDRAVISPDGKKLAYTHRGRLWIRNLDEIEAREIEGTAGAVQPFWSPGSDFVGYVQEDNTIKLKKVPANGGESITLAEKLPGRTVLGAAWGGDGNIIIGIATTFDRAELFSVSDQSGMLQPYLQPDIKNDEWMYGYPYFLPDGQTLIFSIMESDTTMLMVLQNGDIRKPIVDTKERTGWFIPVYAPSGHIVYQYGSRRSSELWAAPFSMVSLDRTGEPFLITQNGSDPSVSGDGTLVYKTTAEPYQQITKVSREGRIIGTVGQPQEVISDFAVSPDARYVAASGIENGYKNIWIHGVDGTKRRLTFNVGRDEYPTWSPDGDQIVFGRAIQSSETSTLYISRLDGMGGSTDFISDPVGLSFSHWSPSNDYIVFQVFAGHNDHNDIWYTTVDGKAKPKPFLQTPFNEITPAISSDGRFVAYSSNESGQYEVYVKPFPQGEGKWQISDNGGGHPKWNSRTNEIFYVEKNNLMAVKVSTRSGFHMGNRQQLFTGDQLATKLFDIGSANSRQFDVTENGQSIIVLQFVGDGKMSIVMMQNWYKEFQRL